jgi:hypothetical protein
MAGATIVHRIRSYTDSNNNTLIWCIWKYNQIKHVTSKQIANMLQDKVVAIGVDTLHIAKEEIGTHSIRSGAAMAMFVGGCSIFQIMMLFTVQATPFCVTFQNRSRNSTTAFLAK